MLARITLPDCLGPPPRAWGTRTPGPGGAPVTRSTPTRVGNTGRPAGGRSPQPVHPHARGEHGPKGRTTRARRGPPPRAWGTRSSHCDKNDTERSTPTRVGNTTRGTATSPSPTVHPHARGEHASRSSPAALRYGPPPRAWGTHLYNSPDGTGLGPPPRAWGTHMIEYPPLRTYRSTPTRVGNTLRVAHRLVNVRSTPTRVGNTPGSAPRSRAHPVHPHARGEHVPKALQFPARPGPPPRAWGTPVGHDDADAVPRSTPTRVGNTPAAPPLPPGCSVHPHARGEHTRCTTRSTCTCGPPPRAWGTQARAGQGRADRRSTPTRVGNTPGPSPSPLALAVHPHARGEHSASRWASRSARGPPPRAWGTRTLAARSRPVLRSTPTRVGNTRGHRHGHSGGAVHPHARGEHKGRRRMNGADVGPPPRAWGTRCSTPTPGCVTSVHPHARGEHAIRGTLAAAYNGPPPRAWGTRGNWSAGCTATPAVHPHARGEHAPPALAPASIPVHPHARGEHAICLSSIWTRAVHPHARGEHTLRSRITACVRGPPPRAWGTLSRRPRGP